MVSRVSYSSVRGKHGSNFPSLRGNYVPKLNLQFSLNELSTADENKLFGNFRKGQIKSAPLKKSQKAKNEMATSSVALERQRNLPERGNSFLRGAKQDSRNGTPKTRTQERNAPKTKACQEYVRNYANVRILGSGKKKENVLLVKRREKYEKKNPEVEIPLKFSGDVIEERGDIPLVSYPRKNSKTLFIYQRNFNKPTRGKNRETRGINPRNQTCLPVKEEFSLVRPNPTYLYKNQSPLQKEDKEDDEMMNFTIIWEQHVLSLVSKTTAQWIASQCSIGEQRERLICFLDEFYDEREPSVSGAGSVRKLVDIDDDCITVRRKRKDEKLMVRESKSY